MKFNYSVIMISSVNMSPFQGLGLVALPLTGLRPVLVSYTLSGLSGLLSPEGVGYTNDGYSPSITSPEGVRYTNDRCSPLITSPEGATYANDGYSPSNKKPSNKTSPEGALYKCYGTVTCKKLHTHRIQHQAPRTADTPSDRSRTPLLSRRYL